MSTTILIAALALVWIALGLGARFDDSDLG
jgi:hypothetical protein